MKIGKSVVDRERERQREKVEGKSLFSWWENMGGFELENHQREDRSLKQEERVNVLSVMTDGLILRERETVCVRIWRRNGNRGRDWAKR